MARQKRSTADPKRTRLPRVCIPEVVTVDVDRGVRVRYNRPWSLPVDCLSVYLVGGPRYRIGDRTLPVTPPFALILPKGTWDEDLQEGKVDGICVHFRGCGIVTADARTALAARIALPGGGTVAVPLLKQISPQDAEALLSAIRRISGVGPADQVVKLTRASHLLQAIGAYCGAQERVDGAPVHREAYRLRDLIARNAYSTVPLSRLYYELDLSASRAGQLFGKAFGMAPVEYRTRLRMERARELLVSTQYNVGRVARAVGFSDQLYFSRVFKSRFGVKPSRLIVDFASTRSGVLPSRTGTGPADR